MSVAYPEAAVPLDGKARPVTQSELLWAYVSLIVVELLHLKWIWLEYRRCPRCGEKNVDCGCPSRRLLKYL